MCKSEKKTLAVFFLMQKQFHFRNFSLTEYTFFIYTCKSGGQKTNGKKYALIKIKQRFQILQKSFPNVFVLATKYISRFSKFEKSFVENGLQKVKKYVIYI